MTDTRGFDAYFANRSALTGSQPTAGDEILALRSGTVFRGSLTYNKACILINDNALETTINTATVFEQINGNWALSAATPALSLATGQITYAGVDQIEPALITAGLSLTKPDVGEVEAEAMFFANGSPIGSAVKLTVSDADVRFVNVMVVHTLSTGDVIEVKIRNNSNTENLIAVDVQLVINQ